MFNNIKDQRVHLLFYFFDGFYCKANDFNHIKKFQKYVNVIPLIAKADSFNEKSLKE